MRDDTDIILNARPKPADKPDERLPAALMTAGFVFMAGIIAGLNLV